MTATERICRRCAPRMLIWVWGDASGVFGWGEIASLPLDAPALAGAARAAMTSPAIRYPLLGCIARQAKRPRRTDIPHFCGK